MHRRTAQTLTTHDKAHSVH